MKTIKFQINGTTPLMLNNPQVINPFNAFTKQIKAITSKRKKTEDDQLELMKLQFLASIYTDKSGAYIIPAEHFKKSLETAAKENKLGKKFEQSVFIFQDALLQFSDMDKTPEQLYEIGTYVDARPAQVGGFGGKSKIIATRFIVPDWSTTIEVMFDEKQVDEQDVIKHLEISGIRYGIGTYRKMFGRFEVKEI